MFLIAKIVRGRRLLHELEKSESEKERQKEKDRERERADSNLSAKNDIHNVRLESTWAQRKLLKKKSGQYDHSHQATTSAEADSKEQELRRRKTWNMERTKQFLGELGRRSSRTFTNLYENRRSIRVQRNASVVFESDDEGRMESTRLLLDYNDFQLESPVREILIEDVSEEVQYELNYEEDYNLWFDDYSKALRQKTENCLGIEKQDGTNSHRFRRTSSMPSVVEALNHAVTTTEKVRHYNYEVKLNKLQKRALRFTWHRLQTRNGGKRVENVFEEIYERLMRMLPSMREMFTTRTFISAMAKQDIATLRDHARFTAKMFELVIKNLDTEDKKRTDTLSAYDPVLIGRAHTCLRPYGFVGSMWEKLGEIIIDVVLTQEAVRDLPGAGQAWVVLTACIIDQLRAGFEQNRENYTRYHGSCSMSTSQQTHSSNYQQQRSHIEPVQQSSNACPLQFNINFKYADDTPGTDEENATLNGSPSNVKQDLRKSIITGQKQSSRNNSAEILSPAISEDECILMSQTNARNSLPCPANMTKSQGNSAECSGQLLSPHRNSFAGHVKQYGSSDNISFGSNSTLSNSRRGSHGHSRDDSPIYYRSSVDNQL